MKNWKRILGALALGGLLVACGADNRESAEETINVITREEGSGTRSAFIELTGILEKDNQKEIDHTYEEASVQSSTNAVLTNVEEDKNAIGYISLGSLNDTVRAVSVEGVEANSDKVSSGDYLLARNFNIVYKKDLPEEAMDFVKFIMSKEGQNIVTQEGYVGSGTAESYTPTNNKGHISVGGSTSITPLMEKLIEAYQVYNPDFKGDLQASGSSAGISGAVEGTIDIGMASRELKEEERSELEIQVLAIDGIALVVNKENPIESITMEGLKEIFTGEVRTWTEVK